MTVASAPAAAASPAAAAAGAPASKASQGPRPRVSIEAAIADMAVAVQRGDFAAAEAIGAAAPVHLALPREALSNFRPLAEGAQAAVYCAQLAPACLVSSLLHDGELSSAASSASGSSIGSDNSSDGASLEVAVKRPRVREPADLHRFRREAALLAQLRHPHIVRLLGARLLPPDYQLVLALEATNAEAELHGAGWRPSWPQLLPLAAQLAAAVAHMHAAGYVHRDIKPANMLLNQQRSVARLADLGLAAPAAELASGDVAHAKPTGGFHKQHMVGTLQYLSPEVLLGRPHSLASDVFALAVTVNELAVGAVPYSDCTRDNPLAHTVLEMGYGRQELAAAVAAEGLRPTMHEGTPPPLRSLLEACWAREPAQRPTVADVASQLAAMAAAAAAAASPPAVPSTPQPAVLPAVLPVPPSEHARRLFASGSDDDGGCVDASGSDKPAALWRVHVHTDGDAEMAKADAASSSPCSSGTGTGSPSSKSAPGGLPAWLAPLQQQQQQVEGALGAQGLQAGTFLTAGRRDAQEDTLAVLHAPFGTAAPGCTALGVFDGHRGGSASDYLAAHLQQHLAARLAVATSGADLLGGALLDADGAFRAADDAAWQARLARMGQAAAGRRPSPGSTATLLLVYPGQPHQGQPQPQQQMLAVAHLGDSRVVLCRDGQAIELTRDHTADLPDERQRIQAAGGACSVRAGGWRVGEAGLQVTRSVGDADLKDQGVTAEAETAELALTPGDSFVVAATDGLWDRISNEEAVALVQDTVKHPAMCAQRLVLEALARGSGDNISCIVAFLNSDGSTAERVYHQGQLKYGAASARRAAVAISADEMGDTY